MARAAIRWATLTLAVALPSAGCGGKSGSQSQVTKPVIPGTDITIDPAPLPDLVPGDPSQMSTDSAVSLHFVVANAGGGDASNVTWRVTRADGTLVREDTLAQLKAGEVVDLTVSDGPAGVDQTFTVGVDPAGAVAESHEDNNSLTITSVFIPTTPPSTVLGGNLALNGAHPHNAIYDENPSFHFFVDNDSDQDLRGIVVTVRDEATGADLPGFPYAISSTIPARTIGPRSGGAGEEQQGIFANPFGLTDQSAPKPSPGRHVYHIILDPGDAYTETDEADNDWRIVVNVPGGYGYWPMTADSKDDARLQDPHIHPADPQRYLTFHGYVRNAHPTRNLMGYVPSAVGDPAYPGVTRHIVPFVVRREGEPVTVPGPGLDRNRQLNLGVAAGRAYFVLPSTGLAPNGVVEYLFIVKEPMSVGEVNYSLDIDPDNVIDEQYEGPGSNQSKPFYPMDNNHADWVVVMDPLGNPG